MGLIASACSPVQQEEKPVEIPFTQDDLTQIYSLAFDSLLGPSEQWLKAEPLIINDSIVVETIFRNTFGEDYPRKTDLLSEKRYWRKSEKALQKYDGFDIDKFKEIIADSSLIFKDYQGVHKVNSSYNYKPSIVIKHSGFYYKGEPLAAVALEKVAFNKIANYAMVIGSIYRGPDWSHGNAYFLKKENCKWRVVGVNRLFIS
ncbi:hypothetical protein WG947_02895 [Pontibacter sp. H259]|uniref:hypothetical protein n=1 Tax=Pontibacter sp. H259 TaxID=3133421 RepID=UPI0030BE8546